MSEQEIEKEIQEMVEAARDQHEGEPYLPVSLHKAMINAAPAVRGEPVAWLVTGPYEKAAFAYKETAEKYCAGLNMGYGEEAYKIRELYAAPQPTSSAWAPSGGDYDRSIHSNPDPREWADFFLDTFPDCGADRDTMAGWFANAMMAKADSEWRQLLDRVVPRIDAGGPNPIDKDLHCCE